MENIILEKPLFGKKIIIEVYNTDTEIVMPILEEAYLEALRLEKIFNFYNQNSELSKLNKERRSENASKELIVLMKKAKKFCKLSNGEYDISSGKQIIDRKNGAELRKILCTYKDIKISGKKILLDNEDVVIDLGSIAKGYIADKVVEFLKNKGIKNGYVDARGDLNFFGNTSEKVNIQHPRNKSEIIKTILIKNMAVATSGDYNQFYGSFDKSHIINSKDLISVTVVAKNLTDADALASVIFLSDKSTRENIIKNLQNIYVFTIDKGLKVKEYNKNLLGEEG
jgi:thiamine biosynthesis lipoprotein